jgi:nucleoside triphosphate diphosphatase
MKPETKRLEDLVSLMSRLRAPDGCPWDREQTFATLGPMLIEEAYEVIESTEASESADRRELRDELGDLLFQIVFYAQIASEEERPDRFDIYDAISSVHEKMLRRHPHVFGGQKVSSTAEVLANWEAIKAAERISEPAGARNKSILDGVSAKLPSLLEAHQLTTKAARVGFDWKNTSDIFEKLDEEIAELHVEIVAEPQDTRAIEGEIGDLLFVMVNIARRLGIEPEVALKSANRKFRRRFNYIENSLGQDGRSLSDASLDEMDRLWDEAKTIEKRDSD